MSPLEVTATASPGAAAVIFGDQTVSYADLNRRANQVANLLASRGIGAGDRVALSCPNVPYFVEVFWGVRKVGAELVPIDVSHDVGQVLDRAAGCRAHFAFEALGPIAIGDIAWQAHRLAADSDRQFFLITLDTGFPEPLEPPEFYHPLVAAQPDTFASSGAVPVPDVEADPAGRWLVLVPLADPMGHRVLVESAVAGAALVLIPHASERVVADARQRAGVTRDIH